MSLETKDIVNFWKRSPVLCVCIVLFTALLLSLYFRIGARDELETSLADQTKLRNKLAANVKYGTGLTDQTERLRRVNALLASNTLKSGELALNQQFFLRLEADTGIKIVDLRPFPVPAPAKDAAADAFVPLSFGLNVTGDYAQLMTFLKRLEQGPTLCRVRSASLSYSSTEAQTLSLTVDLLGLRS